MAVSSSWWKPTRTYEPPAGGRYFEVAFKPNPPPVESPAEMISPDKNVIKHDGDRFFIFEEHFRSDHDRGEWSPQFVRHRLKEVALHAVDLLQIVRVGLLRLVQSAVVEGQAHHSSECCEQASVARKLVAAPCRYSNDALGPVVADKGHVSHLAAALDFREPGMS